MAKSPPNRNRFTSATAKQARAKSVPCQSIERFIQTENEKRIALTSLKPFTIINRTRKGTRQHVEVMRSSVQMAVWVLDEAMMGRASKTQVRAACEVLKHAWNDPTNPDAQATQINLTFQQFNQTNLTAEDKRAADDILKQVLELRPAHTT